MNAFYSWLASIPVVVSFCRKVVQARGTVLSAVPVYDSLVLVKSTFKPSKFALCLSQYGSWEDHIAYVEAQDQHAV